MWQLRKIASRNDIEPIGQDAGRDPRAGFSLIEILVGLAIVVVVATVVTPNLIGLLDRARVDRATSSLESINDAVIQFVDDVEAAPSSLTQLVQPVGGALADACGQGFGEEAAGRWAGPYLSRVVPTTGLPVAVGTVLDVIERIDSGAGATLRLTLLSVRQEDAIELERRIDADADASSGAVRFSAPSAEGLVTLHYHLPAGAC